MRSTIDVEETGSAAQFTEFVNATQNQLRNALVAGYGLEVGRAAAEEALVYGWEHWDRVRGLANPAGYLYRVGTRRAQALKKRRPRMVFDSPPPTNMPWIEPGLPAALAELSPRQRTVVVLVHGYGLSWREAARLLGISAGSVQRHLERVWPHSARLWEWKMTTDLRTQIRGYFDELNPPFDPEELMTRSTVDGAVVRPAARLRWRRRPGWVYAVATAAVVLVLVGGPLWLSRFLGEEIQSTITQPTRPPPSTTVVPVPASVVGPPVTQLPLTFAVSDVPAFEGTVHQTAFWDGLGGEFEAVAVRIEFSYGGPEGGFRGEIVDAPESPARQSLTAAMFGLDYLGSFRAVDNGVHHFYGAEGVLERRAESYDPLKVLVWNHTASASWEELCERTSQEVTAQGEVAGRMAHVVVCAGVSDTWTLWVDVETGLVLKLEHERAASRIPTVGEFEFETINYDPVIGSDTFDATSPLGSEVFEEGPASLPTPPGPSVTYPVPEVPIDSWEPWGDDVGLTLGEPFPAFTASLLDGTTFEVAANREKPLLMLVWYANTAYIDAGPDAVDIDALNLAQAYFDLYADTIDFVAVANPYSSAPPEVADLIRESHGYTLPIAVDPKPFTMREVMWVLIDTNGNVLAADCGCHNIRIVVPSLIAEALDAARR
jgi:RNA polymerase sigma-70 factor (ECF subfamily)